MERLRAQTEDYDPMQRIEAIAALHAAPRAQAVPMLAQIAKHGDPENDRDTALVSLYTIAATQGDTDNAIRSVLRDLIYDGNDAAVSANAAAALESLEVLP
jgi:hypothetical protein